MRKTSEDVCVYLISWQYKGLWVRNEFSTEVLQIRGGLGVNVEIATTIFGFWEINSDPNQTLSTTKV